MIRHGTEAFLSVRRPPPTASGRTFAPRKDSEKTYNQTERAYSRPVRSYGFARPGYCGRMTEGHSQFSLISAPRRAAETQWFFASDSLDSFPHHP